MPNNNETVVYQTKTGAIQLREDVTTKTIWATQAQIASIFQIERSVVTKHIGKVFGDNEVVKKSNVQKMHIANSNKPVSFYSLDVILAVGYRTNSTRAIQFRQWSTTVLHSHIVEGYTIDPKRIEHNYDAFMRAVTDVKKLLPASQQVTAEDTLELIALFANTWFSLDAYDTAKLPISGSNKKKVKVTAKELSDALQALKNDLINKKEATELFAQEKQADGLSGIVGNVFQSVLGQDAYPTHEEKAAHLLYFIVKNHPFTDGNKRSGAFAFIWYLNRTALLKPERLTPEALTVLTLLIAESNPKEKERIIGLILLLLKKH